MALTCHGSGWAPCLAYTQPKNFVLTSHFFFFSTSPCSLATFINMLSAIAMCVHHTSSISAVVPSIFIRKSFLIRSVSLRSRTFWNWMCLSFSASVGRLHLSASPRIPSTSSSGVSLSFMLISGNSYILHRRETGLSIELCRKSIKSLALLLLSCVIPLRLHQRGSTARASFVRWDPRN